MALLRRLSVLFGKRDIDGELDDEVRSHIEMRADELTASGIPPEEARRQAMLAFGNRTYMKEETRSFDTVQWLESFLQDVRYGLRQLARNPGFTLVAALTLALGIGANTAMFSVLEGVVLRPLPYAQPEQLVTLLESNPGKGFDWYAVSPPDFLDWQAQNHTFAYIAATSSETLTLTGHEEPRRLRTVFGTPDIFRVYGVQPMIGRSFTVQDAQIGREHVAVLSHALWQNVFNADIGVVGKAITLNADSYTVIGVLPADFHLRGPADIFVPMAFRADIGTQRGAHYLRVVGRLKPDVTFAEGRADIQNISQRLAKQYPDKLEGWGALVLPMREAMVGDTSGAMWVLLGAVSLLVLIACANIANLLLARANGRRREIAVRTALGASRMRVVRQLLVESFLLAVMGAFGGLLLARWMIQLIVRMGPKNIPRLNEVSLDPVVLLFAAAVTITTAFLFGLIPAWKLARVEMVDSLRQAGVQTQSHDSSRMRTVLVAAELALSLMLLTGAGLLVRSFVRLINIDPGIDPSNTLTFGVSLPQSRYGNSAAIMNLQSVLAARLQQLPGVKSVASTTSVPLSGKDFSSTFQIVGGPPVTPENEPSAQVRAVSAAFFETLRIPLVNGRYFTDADRLGSRRVLVVNQAAVRAFWPTESPIGKNLRFGAQGGYERIEGEIVGVVGDVRDSGLNVPAPPTAYAPLAQAGWSSFNVLVRTAGPIAGLGQDVRRAVHDVDPDLPVAELMSVEEVVASTLAPQRFYTLLLSAYSFLALGLAAVGIYGVMSYTVGLRVHEIGIRLALGASRGRVLKMLLQEALLVVAAGMVIGVIGALALSRFLRQLLFGVSPTDPLTFLIVSCVLVLVAVVACIVPARRAMLVDPMRALRYE